MYIVFLSLLMWTAAAQTPLQDVVAQLNNGKYRKVHRCFDATMQDAISKKQLVAVWQNIVQMGGKLKSVENVETKKREDGIIQTGLLKFEKITFKIRLAQGNDKKISGLLVTHLGYQPASYTKGLGTGKKRINFSSDSLELTGELMVPVGCNNCALVVLVHGSGPGDKDETIGPNKIFYDLALGLASKGVATFRYDKRFHTYPELMSKQFDLYDETINDAIAALLAVQNDTSLTFGTYAMLGHSLGAYSMPLIADSLRRRLDGAILFSANARRLEDLIEYQMKYLTGFDALITDDEEQMIIENTARARNIRQGNYSDSTAADVLLAYWPGKFWKGIADYNPVATVLKNDTTPFLILQGEKDYQITMEDFAMWENAVGNKPNIKMKSFEGLTHLFTPTDAEIGSPQDYFIPNNVDEKVINEIAMWVNEL